MSATPRRAITIGNFDGVHLGHRALIGRARELVGPASGGGRVTAMAFHPHPFASLRPALTPPEIEPWDTRVRRLTEAGADRVVRLEPTPDLLAMTPAHFVDWLMDTHNPTHVVEGPDFHFGKGRAGNTRTLVDLAESRGVAVDIVLPVIVTLRDQSEVVASSSLVRWLLAHGRVRDAAYALGRPHELTGTVVQGDRLGRTIGFPTANLSTPCLCPGEGVYAGVALLPDASRAVAAVHVGARPAIDRTEHRVEAYLMDHSGDRWNPPPGLPESGWSCTLCLIGRVRDIVKVNGLPALVAQITRDCQRCLDIAGPFVDQTPAQPYPEHRPTPLTEPR